MSRALRRRVTAATIAFAAACSLTATLAPSPARADAVADFYKGKSITLVISVGEGDGMDKAARMIARHWSRHIPGNPTIIPKNMPGAGSLRATSFLYGQAPKDGTTIAAIIPAFVMQQLLGGGNTGGGSDYDAGQFGWIGSSNASNATIYVWHTTGVTTLQEAMTRELVLGGTGVGSNSVHYPTIVNHVLGTRFRIVMGYRASPDINLAIQRGEVQGRAGETFNTLQLNNPSWISERKINLLAQIGRRPERGFESVPMLSSFARDDLSRAVLDVFGDEVALGRPYLAPPGVPAERLAALRAALDAAMRDPALLADAKALRLDIAPTTGATLATLVRSLLDTRPEVVAMAKAAMKVEDASVRNIGGTKEKKQ